MNEMLRIEIWFCYEIFTCTTTSCWQTPECEPEVIYITDWATIHNAYVTHWMSLLWIIGFVHYECMHVCVCACSRCKWLFWYMVLRDKHFILLCTLILCTILHNMLWHFIRGLCNLHKHVSHSTMILIVLT